MEITINIPGLNELAASMTALALAIGGQATNQPGAVPQAGAPAPNLTLVQPQQPVQQPAAVPVTQAPAPQQPIQQAPQPAQQPPQAQQQPVPTTTQEYTLEQLAVAATQLMDAGKRTDLVSLLGRFGVQALTALPKEQYGTFATELRALGAKV